MSMDDETDSRYTTGDIAKLTGVSVRTVQYYDAKGLLIPNEISDGGRRLYGTAEVERMRVILISQRTRLQAGADSLDSVGRAAGTGAG